LAGESLVLYFGLKPRHSIAAAPIVWTLLSETQEQKMLAIDS
jgi:hypothetical protein